MSSIRDYNYEVFLITLTNLAGFVSISYTVYGTKSKTLVIPSQTIHWSGSVLLWLCPFAMPLLGFRWSSFHFDPVCKSCQRLNGTLSASTEKSYFLDCNSWKTQNVITTIIANQEVKNKSRACGMLEFKVNSQEPKHGLPWYCLPADFHPLANKADLCLWLIRKRFFICGQNIKFNLDPAISKNVSKGWEKEPGLH